VNGVEELLLAAAELEAALNATAGASVSSVV